MICDVTHGQARLVCNFSKRTLNMQEENSRGVSQALYSKQVCWVWDLYTWKFQWAFKIEYTRAMQIFLLKWRSYWTNHLWWRTENNYPLSLSLNPSAFYVRGMGVLQSAMSTLQIKSSNRVLVCKNNNQAYIFCVHHADFPVTFQSGTFP